MKPEWLNRDIMVLGGYYTLCTTEKQFRRELKRLKVQDRLKFLHSPTADASVHCLTNENGKACWIVCLGDVKKQHPVEVEGLLIHEAVHIWQEHCHAISQRSPSDEEEAYAIQRIAQSLLHEYRRQTKKGKKQCR